MDALPHTVRLFRALVRRSHSRSRARPRGLTIVELTVVVGVVGIVLALTLSVYGHAVRLSRQTACLNNLRQLSHALNAYYTDNHQFPADDRPERFEAALRPLVKDRALFRCPADPRQDASSYAAYYVHRRETNPRDFILGCPRHAGGRVATVLFGSAGTEGNQLGAVTHNGRTVNVGDRVTGGMLRFTDGSVASMTPGLSVDIVTSFERSDGSYYTVLRVPLGEAGTVGLDVNPNSRLEVITPAAIAGSEGTRFYVRVYPNEQGADASTVYVKKGKVRITSRGLRPTTKLAVPYQAFLSQRPSGKIVVSNRLDAYSLPWLPPSQPTNDVLDAYGSNGDAG